MITLRKSEDRGHFKTDWLDSRHSFSFGDYYDPRHLGFSMLRVINEDRVAPGGGFPTHPHRDMEIVTYVLEGALEHRDSLGTGAVIRPGDVQRMSAGTGIRHSEFNPSAEVPTRFLQIWILPDTKGVTPSYAQTAFPEAERRGRLRLVASPDGQDGAIGIHQDVRLFAALLHPGESVRHDLGDRRVAWIQVAAGAIAVNGLTLGAGDGAAIARESVLTIDGTAPSEFLLFDMPALN
jgi:redox-sensitive bicupin YhaK (pirin superfamily)